MVRLVRLLKLARMLKMGSDPSLIRLVHCVDGCYY